MQQFLIYFILTPLLVLDCVVLIFLVLIQLPKKEAGAGLAFGGSATDALFGAGSGTVLTKITKYAATTFFVLALLLSVMQSAFHRRTTTEFEGLMANPKPAPIAPGTAPAPVPVPATAPTTKPGSLLPSTNLPVVPAVEDTNLPPKPTNAAAPPAAPK